MARTTASLHGLIDRRSFLGGTGRFAFGGLMAGAIIETMLPESVWGQQVATSTHAVSARLVERLRTRVSFQISVDVNILDQGLGVAAAALAGGVDVVEMGTPLIKSQGVANVVPAFRKRFPEALLLADMKTMDGGGGEARGVYAGGGNIVDFLALAGVDTAKSICAVRDEFRRAGAELPRLVFADIMVPHQGPAAQAGDVALRMLDAGVDAVGIHLQADARRANQKLIESDYLGEVARAVFDRVGKAAPVQVVGGLSIAQAKTMAKAGLRAFVISGNMGLPDGNARYNLPPAEIQGLVAGFISESPRARRDSSPGPSRPGLCYSRRPGRTRREVAFLEAVAAVDSFLLRLNRPVKYTVIAATVLHMIAVAVPNVPRAYVDYARFPLLSGIRQHDTYGPDTIGNSYVAKVVLNDPLDMYTKARLEQTPLEMATWTREESAPYPAAGLLTAAGLYAIGAATGVEFYGMVLLLAALFVALSLWYFLKTRWYLFPLLYLNFAYFGHRFVYVQDDSYLAMLVVVMIALVLARSRRNASHLLMALAITMKISPVAYARELLTMRRSTAMIFAAILLAGFVLPYFIWDNYLTIFTFHAQVKGNVYDTVAAVLLVVPFTIVLWYVQARLGFDIEDRIGWSLVPFAMFVGIKMRVARHLLIVLLVPDKRGPRNITASIGLALYAAAPEVFRLGSVLYITTVLLFAFLAHYLWRIGWATIRDDARHPLRTVRLLLSESRPGSPAA